MACRRASRGAPGLALRSGRVARRLADERGQIIPLLMVAMTALLATGVVLFQTGRASDLRAQAQTGADAAALGGAHELKRQILARHSVGNVDRAAIRAAAADYAARNGTELTYFEHDNYDIKVGVRTQKTLGGEEAAAAPDEDDDKSASARARARVQGRTGFNGFGFFGGLGATTEGLAPALKKLVELAKSQGLSLNSSTGGVHAEGSFHYQGLAIDVGGTPAQMRAFHLEVYERYGADQILELFYDGAPFYVDDGRRVSGAFGDHTDHVHIALLGNARPRSEDESDEEGRRGSGRDDEQGSDDESSTASGGGGLCDGAPSSSGPDATDEDDKDAGRKDDDKERRGEPDGPPTLSEVRDSESVPAIVYAVGRSLGATPKEMLAAFEAAIVESGFRNLNYGDRDSLGVFQQRANWGSVEQRLNVVYAAREFFKAAKGARGGTAGQLAQDVQVSAHPERYDQVESQAEDLIRRVENGERPVIRGGLGAIAPCGLGVGGGPVVRLVQYGS